MVFRSPFQVLATLVLFALVISPAFSFSPPDDDDGHVDIDQAPVKKQSIDLGKHSGDTSSELTDEKILSVYNRGAFAPSYGGLGIGGGSFGGMGIGGLGRSYGYGRYHHGGYSRSGCRRASTCICHCLNGAAVAAGTAQTAQGSTKP